jgi:hypothetical protein
MLDLATWSDQFILILANQSVTGDRLKIAHIGHHAKSRQRLSGSIIGGCIDVDDGLSR